jgi:hypothetical protein
MPVVVIRVVARISVEVEDDASWTGYLVAQ